jgi:hypothetical protein
MKIAQVLVVAVCVAVAAHPVPPVAVGRATTFTPDGAKPERGRGAGNFDAGPPVFRKSE